MANSPLDVAAGGVSPFPDLFPDQCFAACWSAGEPFVESIDLFFADTLCDEIIFCIRKGKHVTIRIALAQNSNLLAWGIRFTVQYL